jgi:uncharacterized membrane protein YqiK
MKIEPLLEAVAEGHLVACHRKMNMKKLISDRFN